MATYSAKLVDHVEGHETFKSGIARTAQALFNQAFEGAKDSVMVSWGPASPTDNLVVHFVLDRDHSHILGKWPDARIAIDAGGHTHISGPVSCTEIYGKVSGHTQHVALLGIAVFHEALHNLWPSYTIEQMHNLDGGGEAAGMAAARYSTDSKMTEHNKTLIRQGFASKTKQCVD